MSLPTLQTLESWSDELYATPPAPLPFDRTIDVRSFLLHRSDGNLLVYNSPGIASATADIHTLGGAERLLINHSHEAMFGPQGLEADAWVHGRDHSETAASLAVEGTFGGRDSIGDDCEIIPTPGHTRGTTAFLWDSGHRRFLFTGDTLWVDGDQWSAVLLGSGDRAAYLNSLETMRELEFDVLVPWGARQGQPFAHAVTHQQARRSIAAVMTRLERGENS